MACVLTVSGCATTGGRARGPSEFTSRSALQALGAEALPSDLFDEKVTVVPTWDLQGPFPASPVTAMYVPGSLPTDALLAEAVSTHAGMLVPSQALGCVARELGRFLLHHGTKPEAELEAYLTGACRDVQPGLALGWLLLDVPASEPDARIVEHMREKLLGVLDQTGSGMREVGLWFGREQGRALALVVAARRTVNVSRASLVPDAAGRISFDAELLEPTERVDALATVGRYGSVPCTPGTATLPRLRFTCVVDPKDPRAWVDLGAYAAQRILGTRALRLLVVPGGQAPTHWVRSPPPTHVTAADAGAIQAAFVRLVNDERRKAGQPAVTFAATESAQLSPIVGHWFAAESGHLQAGIADTIALGVMAGWGVEGGTIQDANCTHGLARATDDVGELVERMIADPSSRAVLFNPKARQLAVAPLVVKGQKALAVLVGTYEFFDEAGHAAAVDRMHDALEKARTKAHVAPAIRSARLDRTVKTATNLVKGGGENDAALQDLMASASSVLQRSVRGFWLETSDPESLEFPEELLGATPPVVVIAITHRRYEEDAWGRFVVLVAYADSTAADSSGDDLAPARARSGGRGL